jgi:hypothetical protein
MSFDVTLEWALYQIYPHLIRSLQECKSTAPIWGTAVFGGKDIGHDAKSISFD